MNAPAAIRGTFSDFRTVKGRKVCQLVIEVPIEEADTALKVLGGVPRPDDPKWVGLARLDLTKAASQPAEKERRPWGDLTPSQQAAIRCGEEEFHVYLSKENGIRIASNGEAADLVRKLCACTLSRKELDEDQRKRVLWHQLDRSYLEWAGRIAHG